AKLDAARLHAKRAVAGPLVGILGPLEQPRPSTRARESHAELRLVVDDGLSSAHDPNSPFVRSCRFCGDYWRNRRSLSRRKRRRSAASYGECALSAGAAASAPRRSARVTGPPA